MSNKKPSTADFLRGEGFTEDQVSTIMASESAVKVASLAMNIADDATKKALLSTLRKATKKNKTRDPYRVEFNQCFSTINGWINDGKLPTGEPIDAEKLGLAVLNWLGQIEYNVNKYKELGNNGGYRAQTYCVLNALRYYHSTDFPDEYFNRAIKRARKKASK